MNLFEGQMYKRFSRSIYTILLCAFLLGMTAWLFIDSTDLNHLPPDSFLKINLDEPGLSAAPVPSMSVTGRMEKPGRVSLLVNNVPVIEKQTGQDSYFSFEKVVLRTGFNIIEVKGSAVDGWRKFQGDPERDPVNKTVVWPTPDAGPASTPENAQTPAPTPQATPTPPICPPSPPARASVVVTGPIGKRKVIAHASYRNLELEVEATLPKNDPRVVDLLAGKGGQQALTQFVRTVFYDFKIQGERLFNRFQDVTPTYEFNGDEITISAKSSAKIRSFSPNANMDLVINPDWRSPDNMKDSFLLTVQDYKVQSYDPLPFNVSKEGASWTGSQCNLMGISKAIKVRLDLDSLSRPDLIARQLRLSPYEFYPFAYQWLVGFFTSFLVAIPMIWVLWLVERYDRSHWIDGRFKTLLIQFTRLLIAFSFTAPIFFTVNYLSSNRQTWFAFFGIGNGGDTDDLRLLIIITLLMYLVGGLLTLVIKSFQREKAGFMLRAIFVGVRQGAALCFVITLMVGITLKIFPLNLVGLHQIITAAVVFLILLILLVKAFNLYRSTPACYRKFLHIGRWRAVFFIAGYVLLAAFLSFPHYPAAMSDSAIVKVHAVSLEHIRAFLFLLLNLLPYLLCPGLLLLLIQIRNGNPAGLEMSYRISILIFAAYVVGSTPSLLLVTIPFLTAVWIFPRYVIEPAPKCSTLNRIRQRILPKRRELLERYFSTSELKRLQETREQLERNRLAGDISDNDYKVLKSEIDQRVSRHEMDSKFDDDNALKDVVLSVGLDGTQWKNGMWAARKGLVVSFFFSALYLWELLQRFVWQPRSYNLLEIIFPLMAFYFYWVVCAFFFGYFFSCFRGNSGLRKGLNVSGAVILCLLPIWLFSFSSPLALFLRAGQTFLFFTILGFSADYQIFRQSLGNKFDWRKLTQFEEIANFTAFASVLLAGLGTTAGKAVTGHFDVIIKDLVDMAFQQLPKLPF